MKQKIKKVVLWSIRGMFPTPFTSIISKCITLSVIFSLIFSSFGPLFGHSNRSVAFAAEVGYAPKPNANTSSVVDGIGTAKGLSIISASAPGSNNSSTVLPSQSYVDESSGAYLWSLPITLPTGRAGATPSLTLSYDSRRNNPTGYIAKGWDLDIPYIQRINKVGADLMYDRPDFSSSTQGELIKLSPMTASSMSQSGLYGAKAGYGRYELRNDNSWSMTDVTGNTYIYGSIARDREQSMTNSNNISLWYLSSITDTSGNKIEYFYEKDENGRVYPRSIMYGDGMYRVTFEYRTGIIDKLAYLLGTKTDYAAGVRAKADRQLQSIGVVVQSETRLAYKLNSNNTNVVDAKYNIGSITVSGSTNNTPNISETYTFGYAATPVTEVTNPNYYSASMGYGSSGSFSSLSVPAEFQMPPGNSTSIVNTSTWWQSNSNNGPTLSKYSLIDLDGDGFKEEVVLVGTYIQSTGLYAYTFSVYGINTTKTGYELKPSYMVNLPSLNPYFGNTFTPQLADITGDGKLDMILSYTSSLGVPTNSFYRNTGTNFTLDATVVIPKDTEIGSTMYIRDINADKQADIVFIKPAPARIAVYLSTQVGVGQSSTQFILDPKYTVLGGKWSLYNDPLYPSSGTPQISFRDLNGDNLEDMIRGTEVFLNRKTYFDYSEGYSLSGKVLTTQGGLVDITGDNLPDIPNVAGFTGSQPTYDQYNQLIPKYDVNGNPILDPRGVLINTGMGFRYVPSESMPTDTADTSQQGQISSYLVKTHDGSCYSNYNPCPFDDVTSDLNGDGFLDRLHDNIYNAGVFGSSRLIKVHPGTQENVMTSVTIPSGNTSTITYGYETLQNTNIYGAPFSQYVVKSVTDSVGSNTTTYTYTNGLQFTNPADLTTKFAGFATVTTINSEGLKEISYYHQGGSISTAQSVIETSLGEYQDSQYKIGREYRTETYAPVSTGGALAKTVITKWGAGDLGSGRALVFPEKVLTRYTLGGSYDTAVGYTYDTAYGQIVRIHDLGLVTGANDGTFVDTGADTQTTEYKYITNGTLVRQSLVTKRDAQGKVLSQSGAIYDNGVLSRGLVTEMNNWIDSTTIAKTKYSYNSFGLPVSVINPKGAVTTTVYDSFNLYPISSTNPLGQTTTMTYDYMAGKPTKIIDPKGLLMEYTYDSYGREITASRNTVLIRTGLYSPMGSTITHLTKNPVGYTGTTFSDVITLDGLGRVTSVLSSKKGKTYYTYNSSGRRITENVPSTLFANEPGLITTYTYDALGRIITTVNSLGTTTTVYTGLHTFITNPKNVTNEYIYDVRGVLLSVVENQGSTASTTTYTYDGNGNLNTLTDALGNKRSFSTNLRGDILSATDLHLVNDVSYGIVKKTYDILGNVVKTILQDNKVITTTYDLLGRITTTTFGTATTPEETITYLYDTCTATLLCSVTSSLGISTSYTYTPEGFVATKSQTIDGMTQTKTYTYDNQGQIMTMTEPDGTVITYNRSNGVYNNNNATNIRAVNVDGVSIINDMKYDTESRIITMNHGVNPTPYALGPITTTYTYDPTHMLQLTNQKTSITATSTNLIDTTYTYDANGNITQAVEAGYTPLQSTKTYTYDTYDRLTGYTTTPAVGVSTPTDSGEYIYSPTGTMTSSGGDTYSYGPLSLLTPSSQGTSLASKILSALAVLNPFHATTAYAQAPPPICVPPRVLNAATNMCVIPVVCTLPQVIDPVTNTCKTQVLTLDDVKTFLKSKGFGSQQSGRAMIKPGYNKVTVFFKRLFSAQPLISAVPISKTDSKYYLSDITPASFRIRLFEPTTESVSFNWNAVENPLDDELVTESEDDINSIDASDMVLSTNEASPIANPHTLFSETPPINGTVSPTSTFTSPQALTKRGVINGGITYTYDARGNMLSETVPLVLTTNGAPTTTIVPSVTTHQWNTRNMITKTTLPNGDIITYRYAPDGTRVMKKFTPLTVTPTNPVKTTVYFDNDYESDNTATRSRIFLGSVHVATIEKDMPAAGPVTTQVYYQFTNTVGSSTITTDTAGTVIQAQDTKPYGGYRINTDTHYIAPTPATATTGIVAGATGLKDYYALHERDNETNLTYMNARMYDEVMPSFLSLDPTSQYNPQSILQDPQQLNLYAYARGNPVRYNDPSGAFVMKTGKVQKGDTLGGITKQLNSKYRTSYTISQIAKANGIKNSNVISSGSSITLPKSNLELHFDNKTLQAYDKTYGNAYDDLKWKGMSGSTKRGYSPIAEGHWKTVEPSHIQYWGDLSFANKVGSTIGGMIPALGKIGAFPGGTYSWGTQRTELNNVDTGKNNTGFYIHGGSADSPDSAGCIDLNVDNDSFHSFFRDYAKPLDLIVQY